MSVYMPDSDEALVIAYLKGDEKSLKFLFDRYIDDIYNYIRRLTNEDVAYEITSTAFVEIWSKIKKFDIKKSSFKTWVFMIARRVLVNYFNTNKILPISFLDNENSTKSYGDNIIDDTLLPDRIFDKDVDAGTINSLLALLPEIYIEVLILYYQEELNFDQIGVVLQKSLNTVKSQHRRAIMSLREKYIERDLNQI